MSFHRLRGPAAAVAALALLPVASVFAQTNPQTEPAQWIHHAASQASSIELPVVSAN